MGFHQQRLIYRLFLASEAVLRPLGNYEGAAANCYIFLKALNKQIINHCMFMRQIGISKKMEKINENKGLPNFHHETFSNCDFGVALPQL